MRRVRDGIEIDGKLVQPHEFRIMRETRAGVFLSIVVHEGMNRVVRRMMEIAGIEVTALRRERIGPLSVAGIPRGGHRDLTEGELANLLEAVHLERGESGSSTATPAARSASPRPRKGSS